MTNFNKWQYARFGTTLKIYGILSFKLEQIKPKEKWNRKLCY